MEGVTKVQGGNIGKKGVLNHPWTGRATPVAGLKHLGSAEDGPQGLDFLQEERGEGELQGGCVFLRYPRTRLFGESDGHLYMKKKYNGKRSALKDPPEKRSSRETKGSALVKTCSRNSKTS